MAHLDGSEHREQNYLWRIDHLRRTKAHIKFLSIEPLLGPLGKMNLHGIRIIRFRLPVRTKVRV